MNYRSIVTGIGLLLVMCLLCACAASGVGMTPTESAPEDVSVATTVPTNENMATEPAATIETMPTETAETTLPPTMHTDDAVEFWFRHEEIYVYPFTEEEMAELYEYAWELALQRVEHGNTKNLEIHRLAYDPGHTDLLLHTSHHALHPDLPLKDTYGLRVAFSVTCSFTKDEGLPWSDGAYENFPAYIVLYRETHDSPWQPHPWDGWNASFDQDGSTVKIREFPERYPLTPEELSQFALPTGRILGGYRMGDEGYWLFVWDEELQSSRLVKIQTNGPVEPELYDYEAGLPWENN